MWCPITYIGRGFGSKIWVEQRTRSYVYIIISQTRKLIVISSLIICVQEEDNSAKIDALTFDSETWCIEKFVRAVNTWIELIVFGDSHPWFYYCWANSTDWTGHTHQTRRPTQDDPAAAPRGKTQVGCPKPGLSHILESLCCSWPHCHWTNSIVNKKKFANDIQITA